MVHCVHQVTCFYCKITCHIDPWLPFCLSLYLSIALLQYVSPESREHTDISKIITSGYKDPSSWGSYQYTKHCLVHSELQEKEVSLLHLLN